MTNAAGCLLLRHEGVLVVTRRSERLLDGPRAGPADQIQLGAGLVVGAGPTRAAERLLSDDRAGRLVVDVEVARGVAQRGRGLADRAAVAREHRAGQRIRR